MSNPTNLAQAQAQYLANCSYREDRSWAEASLFAQACRCLLLLLPTQMAQGGDQSASFSVSSIKAQLESCESWMASNSRASAPQRVVGTLASNFRGQYGQRGGYA